jgi:N-acetylneuraminic acid mutarotase
MKLCLKAALVVLALNLAFVPTSRCDSFSYTGSLVGGRFCHTATKLQSGLVLVVGGFNRQAGQGLVPVKTAELYDPVTKTWSATESMLSSRVFHAATLLPNGKVLVTGGLTPGADKSLISAATAELYDPATGHWTHIHPMSVARHGHTATLIGNIVLIAGGSSGPDSLPRANPISSAEIYNVTTGVWSSTGSMNDPRGFHRATLLNDGTVLVEGGSIGNFIPTDTSELYNPSSGTWSLTVGMHHARESHAAILLNTGQVLVAGGDNDSLGHGAELYNPSTHAWVETDSLNSQHFGAVAAMLPSGSVLVAGGYNDDDSDGPIDNDGVIVFADGSPTDVGEVYDVNSATWTTTALMNTAREGHTLTALDDGTVLAAGGEDDDTAEIYETIPLVSMSPDSQGVHYGDTTTFTVRRLGETSSQLRVWLYERSGGFVYGYDYYMAVTDDVIVGGHLDLAHVDIPAGQSQIAVEVATYDTGSQHGGEYNLTLRLMGTDDLANYGIHPTYKVDQSHDQTMVDITSPDE